MCNEQRKGQAYTMERDRETPLEFLRYMARGNKVNVGEGGVGESEQAEEAGTMRGM